MTPPITSSPSASLTTWTSLSVLSPVVDVSAHSLERTAVHLAGEWAGLRAEQPRLGGKAQDLGLAGVDVALMRRAMDSLVHFFTMPSTLGIIAPHPEEMKEAEEALREIRTLKNGDHFCSRLMRKYFEELTKLDPGTGKKFARSLFRLLEDYRKERDAKEVEFLKPFEEYRDELLDIIYGSVKHDKFEYFDVKTRLKRNIIAKLQIRQWDNTQKLWDALGIRIIVRNQEEIKLAVEALLESALGVYPETSGSKNRHFFASQTLTVSKASGYCATHMRVQVCKRNRKRRPAAEVQIMTLGTRLWGDPERLLVYKNYRIPIEIKESISHYCKKAHDFISAIEEGLPLPDKPVFDADMLDMLEKIPDQALAWNLCGHIGDMDALMTRFEEKKLKKFKPSSNFFGRGPRSSH